MYDKRQKERLLQSTKDNKIIRSLCVTIEVKSHSGDAVKFIGSTCLVKYNDEWHDATCQSDKQKYSFRKYIEQNSSAELPWADNIIWLRNVLKSNGPKNKNNFFYSDSSWSDFIDLIAQNFQKEPPKKIIS
ncbi:uncharacterized protein METZ01_LOCUS458777, partial [marine metagenome]